MTEKFDPEAAYERVAQAYRGISAAQWWSRMGETGYAVWCPGEAQVLPLWSLLMPRTNKSLLKKVLNDAEGAILAAADQARGQVGFDNFERRMLRQEEEERNHKLAFITRLRTELNL